MKPASKAAAAVPIWDLPLRLFHWILVGVLVGSYLTAEVFVRVDFHWHKLLGYVVLGLVVFRLVWGFVGSRHSRFASFLPGPAAVGRYLRTLRRRDSAPHAGHNPLGALSVLALLLSLLVQAVSGLFIDDEVLAQGPLSRLVTADTRHLAAEVHEVNFNILLALAALHLAAVLYYVLWKRQPLIAAMVSGRRRDLPTAATTRPASPLAFLVAVAVAAGVVLLVVLGLPAWIEPAAGGGSSWS